MYITPKSKIETLSKSYHNKQPKNILRTIETSVKSGNGDIFMLQKITRDKEAMI